MVKGGQHETVSATEFAALTGVSRERLRTWERRFGFPLPVRVAGGRRRYALADARTVVAVRRAADAGTPLDAAITAAVAGPEQAPGAPGAAQAPAATDLAGIADELPAPLLLVSGPWPLTVQWVGRELAGRPGAPRPGEPLERAAPWLAGSELASALGTLFATDTRALTCRHPAWDADGGELVESLLYGVPAASHSGALRVAIVQLQTPAARASGREIAALRAEIAELTGRLERHDRWLLAIGEIAELFRRESGPALLLATADAIVRHLPPVDAGIGVYMGGELAVGSSGRGTIGPRMVTVTAYADLAAVLRESRPGWLAPATAAAFGVRSGLQLLAVPIAVVGETLGAALLVLEEQVPLDPELMRALGVLSAALGFALLRERLVESVRGLSG